MKSTLDEQLRVFLRKRRGAKTYREFGKKIGLSDVSIFRLEQGQQSVTLRTLQGILDRLKCKLSDIFPGK